MKISTISPGRIPPDRPGTVDYTGLWGSERAYFITRLYRGGVRPIVVMVSSPGEAEAFISDLQFFGGSPEMPVIYFPPYNILPFKELSYHSETAATRIAALYRMIENDPPPVVVTTASAAMQRILPRKALWAFTDLIQAGEEIDRETLIDKLISGGYTRSTIVEEPGDYCVRGGILDIFTPGYSAPLRIELFGDTVDSIRFFSVHSQRSTDTVGEAVILPAREAILGRQQRSEVAGRVRARGTAQELPVTYVRRMVDSIKRDGTFPGAESLLPMIYRELDTVFDYVPESALFVEVEPARLENAFDEFRQRYTENYRSTISTGRLCVEPEALYLSPSGITRRLAEQRRLRMKTLPRLESDEDHGGSELHCELSDNSGVREAIRAGHRRENLLRPLAEWIDAQRRAGRRSLLVCRNRSQADRLRSMLATYDVRPEIIDAFPTRQSPGDECLICLGQISGGFVWPSESLAVITEDEIFGPKQRRRVRHREAAQTRFLDFGDLKSGDLVVHNDHGIGRYEGLVKLKLNGGSNDFLLIVYRDEDKLYLPVDRMGSLQKYMGVDGISPSLDKMGGKSWDRIKERVRRSTEKIAGELLKIYAARKVKNGYAFGSVDTPYRDFEAGFAYEETTDQLRAIEDVFADMMAPVPMDRLVCGDVGYGKTEVALRASYLAVFNGKQVAVLVPTTVLAEQHYETFKSRFSPYPINIACLSRFRPAARQREIVDGLKTGKIDIVIGTHRLLQRDVSFKALGLLVLDEEQRFGVTHKERLKKFRTTVDVLALTATPIPRTLHLSMMGIRDISVISTPPEQRQPIITYLSEFSDTVVTEAIRKELARRGQIFFVHNHVQSIERMAAKIEALVPEVRLDVAHGQLDEASLERVILAFFNREIDMLVCTTIIESGLDIPSANTILVNRADRFGLAQMYQLRGRVGRAGEQAYAYLFIPHESTLGKDAQKRLKVLMEHSDLGSGFQIAMSDLKIRGGGTILGASQSGHIAAVGYDMFLKLMEESIAELKGEPAAEHLDPEINADFSAYFPESYISDIDQRLFAYRRLARAEDLQDISDYKAELIDRFGPLPVEAANLLLKIMLKLMAARSGIKRLDLNEQHLLLQFSESRLPNPSRLADLIGADSDRYRLTPDGVLRVRLPRGNIRSRIGKAKNILKEIAQHVNLQNLT